MISVQTSWDLDPYQDCGWSDHQGEITRSDLCDVNETLPAWKLDAWNTSGSSKARSVCIGALVTTAHMSYVKGACTLTLPQLLTSSIHSCHPQSRSSSDPSPTAKRLLPNALGIPWIGIAALVARHATSCTIPVLATTLSPGCHTFTRAGCSCRGSSCRRSSCGRSNRRRRSCRSSSACRRSTSWQLDAATRTLLIAWPLPGSDILASFIAPGIRGAASACHAVAPC